MNNRDGETPTQTEEQSTEAKLQKLGLNAPRITPDHIDAQIARRDFLNVGHAIACINADAGIPTESIPPGVRTLTICILTLANGFTVTGESNCASPENFNAEVGRDIAYRNARDKIWSLEGYALRTQLNKISETQQRDIDRG